MPCGPQAAKRPCLSDDRGGIEHDGQGVSGPQTFRYWQCAGSRRPVAGFRQHLDMVSHRPALGGAHAPSQSMALTHSLTCPDPRFHVPCSS
ncbi:hypothetical protein VFPFJ_06871 [Purpureocillium lilacinum]|uniref:Uncharacterized protein n=1 Tax=Purpureocillium lilacinum TaxID=33203 RepID=A0A179GSD0_PURLI|nr:hypothetical protein VFPFJ_06871 [Purpureocillium lilacinum]OAQ80191.1 hypothetical protein VFPBJ_05776 [Purpureocillium lilacinum]OAQ88406.1 hypothetical protein VFPFJ_06871 [Purpureocillium lilacinum]